MARNTPGKHIPEKHSQGILYEHSGEEPLDIVPHRIEKTFLVGVTEKKRFEIVETCKIRAEELLPVEKTVKKGPKEGQKDKQKNHRQTREYEKKNPKTFIYFFTVHAHLRHI
jgi:hypothetical protein